MRPGPAEQVVHVECHPGKVAEILQESEEGEEDRHRRKHDTDYPGGGKVDAVQEHP